MRAEGLGVEHDCMTTASLLFMDYITLVSGDLKDLTQMVQQVQKICMAKDGNVWLIYMAKDMYGKN